MLETIDLHAQVEPIIRKVGKLQLSYFAEARLLDRQEKDGAGFCTVVDIESEQFLIENLSPIIPGADFFAEESGITGNGDYCWVIDPLDGTINFTHGLPHFCISIALTHKNEVVFGMIYQPVLDELFWAQKGKGAWLNGDRISVTEPEKFDQSLLVIGLPYEAKRDYKAYLQNIISVVPRAYTFRYLGAAALDLAYVACGRFDGIFFAGLAWWDFAAGDLLIREAGGKTSDFQGVSIGLESKSLVAGGSQVYKKLFELLKPGGSSTSI
jgi:myo-inositol-1(or 4)-monophosphatase